MGYTFPGTHTSTHSKYTHWAPLLFTFECQVPHYNILSKANWKFFTILYQNLHDNNVQPKNGQVWYGIWEFIKYMSAWLSVCLHMYIQSFTNKLKCKDTYTLSHIIYLLWLKPLKASKSFQSLKDTSTSVWKWQQKSTIKLFVFQLHFSIGKYS